MATATSSLTERLLEQARRVGFDLAGVAPIHASDHETFYRRWLAEGRHGAMGYLARPDAVTRRTHPEQAWPELRSALVVGHNYYPDDDGAPEHPPERDLGGEATHGDPGRGVIARYARGRDYHKVVKKKLLELLRWLESDLGRELPVARAYVDTGPVLERELARRAGLGWFGRNTMLIHPRRGSYFFIGVLLLELDLEASAPFEADHCGSCRACLDACPTGALLGRDASGAPVMDATRCISYLTIENKGPIPRELRPLIANRVYGCDICQEVCPWNSEKLVRATAEPDYLARSPGVSGSEPGTATHPHAHSGPATDSPPLVELMRMTLEEWDLWTRGSAMRRAGYAGFKRNVAVALGNRGSPEAVGVLSSALEEADPLIRGHAAWALGRIGGRAAYEALAARLRSEPDQAVLREIEAALASARSPRSAADSTRPSSGSRA